MATFSVDSIGREDGMVAIWSVLHLDPNDEEAEFEQLVSDPYSFFSDTVSEALSNGTVQKVLECL